MAASGAGDFPSLDGPSPVGERGRCRGGRLRPYRRDRYKYRADSDSGKAQRFRNTIQPFRIRMPDVASHQHDPTIPCHSASRCASDQRGVLTALVPPTSSSYRRTYGSSWLDWCPVIGIQLISLATGYRLMDSSSAGQRGAGDVRASRSLWRLSPKSPSLRLASGLSIAPVQLPKRARSRRPAGPWRERVGPKSAPRSLSRQSLPH
jgi:hypothetical protein